jgi:2,3-bisphosphoglycerate-independent phosphoglycerate mutase
MRLVAAQCRVAFANAYPPIFFDRLARNTARRTAISHAVSDAGVRYRDMDDLRAGHAVSAFVTNQLWVSRGADVPLISAYTAGAHLARLAQENELTAFEYFLTDAAGHKADASFTARVLTEVDELLRGVLDTTRFEDSLVVTSSDHGNVEDASSTVHTRNPVPTILIGAGADRLAPRIHSLADVTPALVDLLLEK